MRKFLIIGLLFLLPSCSTTQTFFDEVKSVVSKTVTPDNFDNITIAYNGISNAGNTYYNLCYNKVISKSCWNVIRTLQPYEDKAFKTYMALDLFVKTNPGSDATSLVQSARNAINALQSVQLQNGVK